jgi:hypothetical protein
MRNEAPEGLRVLVAALFPGASVERVVALGPDVEVDVDTEKGVGYGRPLRVTVVEPAGWRRELVFRTAVPNEFGHDRRADRAEEMLVAHDLFNETPDHVRSLDVGAIGPDGRLVSLRGTGEFYLVTEWAEGEPYAEDLRRIARERTARPLDLARCEALVRWLVRLHAGRLDDPPAWRRALRDLVGHGEGVFGIADAYPADVPGAPPDRLRRIEERCLAWRFRLRDRSGRLTRTHGDFHPFNVLFRSPEKGDGTRFTLLDASRGGKGDAADDVVAMTVNYVFFALEHREAWPKGLGLLWRRFWEVYLAATGDREILETAPPYLAWRALVLASPRFYPRLGARAREAILHLAERALEGPRFDPAWAEVLFAEAAA